MPNTMPNLVSHLRQHQVESKSETKVEPKKWNPKVKSPQKRKPMSENDLILSIQIEAPHASECAPDTAADEISISISIESALTNNQSEDLENQTKWKNKQSGKPNKVKIVNELKNR